MSTFHVALDRSVAIMIGKRAESITVEVEDPEPTIRAIITALLRHYGEPLRRVIMVPQGTALRPYVGVAVGGTFWRGPEALDVRVSPDDSVSVICVVVPMSGG